MYVAYCFHFRFQYQKETVTQQIFIVSSANSIYVKTPLMENSHFLMLQLMSHLSYPSCQVMKTTTSVHSGLLWKCGATTLPPIHNYTRCFSSTCQQISIVYVAQWASGTNQNSVMTSWYHDSEYKHAGHCCRGGKKPTYCAKAFLRSDSR